jgi:hypothetical protein
LTLLLAGSIAALWQWRKIAGGVAGVAILALSIWVLPAYYEGRHLRDDFQTMTRAVAAYAEPGDALLLVSGDRFPLFQFRYDALPNRAQLPDVTTLSVVKVTPQDVEGVLVPLASSHKRVWLAEVEKNLQDPDNLLAGWLDKNRNAVWREGYGYNRLSLYDVDAKSPVVQKRTGDYSQQVSADGVALLGYDLPVRQVGPGDTAHLVMYLKVNEPFTLKIALVESKQTPFGDALVLESRDQRMEPQSNVVRLRFDVPVYARTPPGEYRFQLSLPHKMVELASSLSVVGTPKLAIETPAHKVSYRVGQDVFLDGFDAHTQTKPGDRFQVKLYWRARTLDKIRERYTVFVQLIGAQYNPRTGGPLWASHDGEPLDGGFPTTQWHFTVPVVDTHVLALPPDTPPGEYELWAGMYTQPDIKRLPVYDAQGNLVGDHVVLSKITVR